MQFSAEPTEGKLEECGQTLFYGAINAGSPENGEVRTRLSVERTDVDFAVLADEDLDDRMNTTLDGEVAAVTVSRAWRDQ